MSIEKGRYVVQEHDSKRAGLHYDLRLEWGGVLKDWVFRKPPPLEYGVKRFGLSQPDHDTSWLGFEGVIANGYGAGTMRIWDSGLYRLLSSSDERIDLYFEGEKLSGGYVMMRYKEGWLLFKKKL